MEFPFTRLRRNRKNQNARDLFAQYDLKATDFIYPIFLTEGQKINNEVKGFSGIQTQSIDLAVSTAQRAKEIGINALALFPSVDNALKDSFGKEALNNKNLICRAIKAIKKAVPDIMLMADIALDPYTSHGHDGVLSDYGSYVDNDKTIDMLCQQSVLMAEAGCDILAPSDMMDGRVGQIRATLETDGLSNIQIFSYSAKYASNLYSPFREAVGSGSSLKKADKKDYQMDYRNSDEALMEVQMDIDEGTDAVIIKPAMLYGDIIRRIKDNFHIPIIGYQVSGEYCMLKLLAQNTETDEKELLLESLISLKRAGCNTIISYAAMEIIPSLSPQK